jgi:hypothetical protein
MEGLESAQARTFRVEAYIGRKAGTWPLARFDVGPESLQVRIPFPWFVSRSAPREAVGPISVGMNVAGIYCLRFENMSNALADVHVHLPVRPRNVIDELCRCGYVVVDRNSGEELDRLPRRSIYSWLTRGGA